MSTAPTTGVTPGDAAVPRRPPYRPISDYGLIGAMHTCALVSRDGSIDWACLPDFDSPSVFGRILDWRRGGHYQVTVDDITAVERRYLPRTNVLETTFTTPTGVARLIDFMPVHPPSRSRLSLGGAGDGHRVRHPRGGAATARTSLLDEPFELRFEEKIIRILECVSGDVSFRMECVPRFDYGSVTPRVTLDRNDERHGLAHGGANALIVYCSAGMQEGDHGFTAQGRLGAGAQVYSAVASLPHFTTDFALNETWVDPEAIAVLLDRTVTYWNEWSAGCSYDGELAEEVLRSALVLKALTYEPSGAIVAAPTTSLPEELGGGRNWDYRFTWIRDASFSLGAFFDLGLTDEADGFKDWLEWTSAYPADLQLMYGIRGERRLDERELDLEGYGWSRPVRVGNGAAEQFQLDIYGELLASAWVHREVSGELPDPEYWSLLRDIVDFVTFAWQRPDAGIWETRGGYRHFVYSKVQCWTALDRGIRLAQDLIASGRGEGLSSVIARWRSVRQSIRDEVLDIGFDERVGAFVQSYGSRTLDASALMLPLVGFIHATDPRMRSTIAAIERHLTSPEGLVYRYRGFEDGLDGQEGTFIICSFWLVQNLALAGDMDKARALLGTLRGYANDLGLFSEEFDTRTGEMLGNFPQAFSHLAFVNSAVLLDRLARGRPRPITTRGAQP